MSERNRNRRRSPLALLLLVGLGLVLLRTVPPAAESGALAMAAREAGHCVPADPSAEACEPGARTALRSSTSRQTLFRASDVCLDVGYLCSELHAEGVLQLLRWPDDSRALRIRVTLPRGEPPRAARELQRAAVRGILAWKGRPLDFVIDDRSSADRPADITVRWVSQLTDGRLGQTRWQLSVRGREEKFQVTDFVLATRSPFNGSRALTPKQIEVTAAHEMGHALGLPHSDDQRDVMFPRNTAIRITGRDYRTVESLYRLPNGIKILDDSQRATDG